MDYDFLAELEKMLQAAKERKSNDGDTSEFRRAWAVVYTDLEKIKAYVLAYLTIQEVE